MVILENIDIDIDIDKAILQNIDIDKISNRFKFGISNRASPGSWVVFCLFCLISSNSNELVLHLLSTARSISLGPLLICASAAQSNDDGKKSKDNEEENEGSKEPVLAKSHPESVF